MGNPVPVILDTDMSGDCDDCGALAILHKLADFGEADILACVVNGRDADDAAGATIQAINSYYGRPGIPVGAYSGDQCVPTRSSYTAAVRDRFHPSYPLDRSLPPAVQLYRKALAEAATHSVVIISIGFLINLRELLESPPDEISALSGSDLVKEKAKRLVLMGGHFPETGTRDGEFNFAWGNAGPHTQAVVAQWPGDLFFSPFESGVQIVTGRVLAIAPVENPVRLAYELYADSARNGRSSWDLLTVLGSIFPQSEHWDFQGGKECQVFPDGTNLWKEAADSRHFYQRLTSVPELIASKMDNVLASAPGSMSGSDALRPAL